jgi:hypothetical protein
VLTCIDQTLHGLLLIFMSSSYTCFKTARSTGSLQLITKPDLLEAIVGGGRRRRRSRSEVNASITNVFYQVNIAIFFIFGGDNHAIYSLQTNAADNEVFVKAISA